MRSYTKQVILSIALAFALIDTGCAQQSPAFSSALARQFKKIESDITTSAEVMPEDKFYFSPEELHIKNADFKGVRSFAGQIMHLATDNILIWSAVTGDPVRADITDVNGPPAIRSKAEILDYLKKSFEVGRRALSMLTEKNAMEMIEFRGRRLPRLDITFTALSHANEHYGQMVVYLRMCGLVPPPTLSEK